MNPAQVQEQIEQLGLSPQAHKIALLDTSKCHLTKQQLIANTNRLLAFALSKKPEAYDDHYPTLSILQDLLKRLGGVEKTCSSLDYRDQMELMKKQASDGLPRYILHWVDHAMLCTTTGIIARQMVADDYSKSYKYTFAGDLSGFTAREAGFFGRWGVPTMEYLQKLQEVEKLSPSTGEACHGCIGFRATRHSAYGPRMFDEDLECNQEIDMEQGGFCECGDHYFPGVVHSTHAPSLTCDAVCAQADYKSLKPQPVKVLLRVETGIIEAGESEQTVKVNFWGKKKTSEDGQQEACPQTCLGGAGNVRINKCSSCECAGCSAELWRTNCNGTSASPCEDSELDTSKASFSMAHLPDKNESATYEWHMEGGAQNAQVNDFHVRFNADSLNGKDSWYFQDVEMSLDDGKFVNLGPVHSWLLGQPYPPKRNFAGDIYKDTLDMKPFNTEVTVTFKTGNVAHAKPAPGLEPLFWVQGAKYRGRWFEGGNLDTTAPGINGTNTQTLVIRKDIGDVTRIKLTAQNGTTAAWFFEEFTVHSGSAHPLHRHSKHNMIPNHIWLAQPPYVTSPIDYYSFNKKQIDTVELVIDKGFPEWNGKTCGGTAPSGSKCKFPFTHEGVEYNQCTTVGRSKYERWCGTEAPGTWAFCDCDRFTNWKGPAGPNTKCAFPFKKNGKWYDKCIDPMEFSKTLTYACHSAPGGRCAGNMPGGVCSTDTLYKGSWGACQARGLAPTQAHSQRKTNGQGDSPGGVDCVFPFYYKGTWNHNCIGDAFGGFGWCSTTLRYGQGQVAGHVKTWGGCRAPTPKAERYIRWPDDITLVVGNHSAPDDKCQFPFIYHGETYYDCVDRSPEVPHGWCSLDTYWKGRWGACAWNGYKPEKPEPGARWTDGNGTVPAYTPCVFPFNYRGKAWDSCVARSDEHPNGWCSTTQNFANKWGDCLEPGSQPPAQDCVLTEWSPWTRGDPHKEVCSAVGNLGECSGTTRRARAILLPAKNGGKPCSTLPELRKQEHLCAAADSCSKLISGAITSSMTGRPVSDAKVTVSCGNDELIQTNHSLAKWTVSDEDGSYSVDHVQPGTCTMHFVAQGYISLTETVKIEVSTSKLVKNKSLNPQPSEDAMQNGAISLTLNWGTYPSDLDAHVNYAPFPEGFDEASIDGMSTKEVLKTHASHNGHFYWMNKGSDDKAPYITLDHDELNGRGPETMSFHKMLSGHYHYYVKCYSCPPGEGGHVAFSKSDAVVSVVRGAEQLTLPLPRRLSSLGQTATSYSVNQVPAGTAQRFFDVITFVIYKKSAEAVPTVRMIPHVRYRKEAPDFKKSTDNYGYGPTDELMEVDKAYALDEDEETHQSKAEFYKAQEEQSEEEEDFVATMANMAKTKEISIDDEVEQLLND